MPSPRQRPPRRPSGRWLAYAIPAVLLLIAVGQAIFKDSIDLGVLGLLAIFGFGALGWSLDDVLGDRVARQVRGHVRDQLGDLLQDPDGSGGNESPATRADPRDHEGRDDDLG